MRLIRAVWMGVAVIVGGSLVMTTIIGLAAVTGMLSRGDTAETIIAELPGSLALAIFTAAGGLVMSLAGGYVAGHVAGQFPVRAALWTGGLATPLSLAILAWLGDSGPAWLTVTATALIMPCAVLGGWLAMPVASAIAPPGRPADVRSE